jgi:hypothetical protein
MPTSLSQINESTILSKSTIVKKLSLVITLCVFGLIMLTFSSCRRYKAFPPALVSYFPYTEHQKLFYANEKGDTTCMVVTELYVSEAHNEPYCTKCGNIAMEFQAQNDSMYFNGFMNAAYSYPYLVLDAGGTGYYYDIPGDPFSDQIASEIGDTIRLSKDDNEAIVVRYEGLVEFGDRQRNCTWKLVK